MAPSAPESNPGEYSSRIRFLPRALEPLPSILKQMLPFSVENRIHDEYSSGKYCVPRRSGLAPVSACQRGPASLSHTMYQSNGFRQSTPPQSRQLFASTSKSQQQVNDFVRELTFSSPLIIVNSQCAMRALSCMGLGCMRTHPILFFHVFYLAQSIN